MEGGDSVYFHTIQEKGVLLVPSAPVKLQPLFKYASSGSSSGSF